MNFDINTVTRVVHEANRALCKALGDDIQLEWNLAPDWRLDPARDGILKHLTALEAGDRLSPAASHEAWLEKKRKNGWVLGPAKDLDKKTHPAMVPYKELPPEKKIKDFLFRAVVEAFHECEQDERQSGR